ncbi:MAG: hypothetical protein HQK54_15810 [Oligoflexales bacterium]|nr:hypothetical protein [Oligoflexales bacterium]
MSQICKKPISTEDLLKGASNELIDGLVCSLGELLIGEMVGGLDHDLRQPLNVMKMVCQSQLKDIEKNSLDMTDLSEGLKDIVGQVNKISMMVSQFRQMAAQGHGMTGSGASVNDIIRSCLDFLGTHIHNRGIETRLRLSENPLIVPCELSKMKQLLLFMITKAESALSDGQYAKRELVIETSMTEKGLSSGGDGAAVVEIKGILKDALQNDEENKAIPLHHRDIEQPLKDALRYKIAMEIAKRIGGTIELTEESDGALRIVCIRGVFSLNGKLTD